MPSHQRYCCVCKNHGRKVIDGKKVSMHRFPADNRLRKVWIQRCKNARPNFVFVNYDQTRLCSRHFVGRAGPTKENTIPSLFPGPKDIEKTYKTSNMVDSYVQLAEDSTNDIVGHNTIEADSSDASCSKDGGGITMDFDTSMTEISLKFHDYGEVAPVVAKIRHQSEQIQPDTVSVSTQTDETNGCLTSSSTQTSLKEVQDAGVQVNTPTLTFDDISDDDEKVVLHRSARVRDIQKPV